MKKKSVLPFAAVLGIAAVWTMLNRGGPHPFRVNSEPFPKSTSTQTTVSVTPSGDETREQKILSLLEENDTLARIIQVHTIDCDGSTCTLDVSALGDPALFHQTIDQLPRDNPWLGSMEKQPKAENPEVLTLVFRDGNP